MIKMRLPVRPKNEGARLLAWWIARHSAGNLVVAGKKMLLEPTQLQRLIDGEIVPGEELVADVAQATAETITRADWRMPAAGGWFDAPAAQERQAA